MCGVVQTDLASVHALVRDEGLGLVLEPVWLQELLELRLIDRRWRNSYVAESNPGERSACGVLLVKSHSPILWMSTYHDQSRGQSPLRHPECIHCAQPVPGVSLLRPSLPIRGGAGGGRTKSSVRNWAGALLRRVLAVKIEPRPLRWLRITLPMTTVLL